MIEVEKKFKLNDEEKQRLIQGAEFLNEKAFVDIYYDTADFSLTSKDKWLRSRDDKFELKISLRQAVGRVADQYDELENEGQIKQALNLPINENLTEGLARKGYLPFCRCKTTRRKYKKDIFIIDIDAVDFSDFSYNIAEIELMINDRSETENAITKIIDFAKRQNLAIVPVRGKVIEYLKTSRPNHYRALVQSGVVEDSL